MSEQTAKPIPTQLNIAPRGKTWKNWELVDGTDGFPTRESMEKYLCNPERVRELEECRDRNLATIKQLNNLLQCSGCAVQQGYVPVETLSAEIKEPQKFTGDSEMRRAFEIEYGQSWADPDWRKETGIWASAWHKATASAKLAAVQQGAQPPFMYAIADGYGQPFFEEEGCVSSEAKDLQPEVDSLNQNLDGEPPYKVVALYTHPTQQGLAEDGMYYLQDARWSAMVGNCPSFWREGGNGYTTNLNEAGRFTFDDAMAQHRCRETDLPWLCAEVDKLRRPTVDCQYMPRNWDEQRAILAAQAKQGGV